MKKYNGQSSNFVYKRTVNIVLIDALASSSGVGERHDLQGPGRLQQAAAVRAQRNEEGGTGGSLMIFDIWISGMSRNADSSAHTSACQPDEEQSLFRKSAIFDRVFPCALRVPISLSFPISD